MKYKSKYNKNRSKEILFVSACYIGFLAVFLNFSKAYGQSHDNPPTIDPQAASIIQSFSDTLKQTQGFKADMIFTQKPLDGPAQPDGDAISFQLITEKPNRVYYEMKMETPLFTMISDGKQLFSRITIPHLSLMQHFIEPAPATLDQLADKCRMNPFANAPIVMSLLAADTYKAFTKDAQSIRLDKTEEHDGKTPLQITLQYPEYDEHLQFEKQNNRIILQRFIIDYVDLTPQPDSAAFNRKPVYRLEWKIESFVTDESIPSTTFAIKPDSTTKLAHFLGEYPPSENPLLGKKTPELSLMSLNGSKVDLADHIGKQIIVLDLWATWCGYCMQAMPTLDQIAANYKKQNKSVVFYAVNQGDPAAKISTKWKQLGYTLPVLLDPQKQAGRLFKIKGLPHTVIIGLDGTIQSIHEGLLPTMEMTLTGEIDYLLSGKKLTVK